MIPSPLMMAKNGGRSQPIGAITGAMQGPFMPRQICVLLKNFDLTPLEVKITLARRLFFAFCFCKLGS